MDPRLELIHHWLREELDIDDSDVSPASADASFRRYFRVRLKDKSLIVMDAPPEKEDCRPFIRISAAMAQCGLHVPEVLEQDLGRGLLLLTDLGNEQYLDHLNDGRAGKLYSEAIDALIQLQDCGSQDDLALPEYNRQRLMNEMSLCRQWFIEQHLGHSLNHEQETVLDQALNWLVDQALEQPQVWVHRDYHSRNLMLCEKNNPGILDFQDAVYGPFTYDLVSLLKDCYISWPRERVESWLREYQVKAFETGLPGCADFDQLLRWFDAMGAQRHIKVLGIFARLSIRDGKHGYLDDLPRVMYYLLDACERLLPLKALGKMMKDLSCEHFIIRD